MREVSVDPTTLKVWTNTNVLDNPNFRITASRLVLTSITFHPDFFFGSEWQNHPTLSPTFDGTEHRPYRLGSCPSRSTISRAILLPSKVVKKSPFCGTFLRIRS